MAFFSAFPTVQFDIERAKYSNFQTVTNIFFRIGVIHEILNNITSYTEYNIRDADTPEILAEKVYGNATSYWIILYTNNIYDPNYDWPLKSQDFNKYIVNKYRQQAADDLSIPVATITDTQVFSWTQIETAGTASVHHYNKVIEKFESFSNVMTTDRIRIDYDKQSTVDIGVPYDTYVNLAEYAFNSYNYDGRTLTETITKEAISIYQYESDHNERNRSIKIIKPEYYSQIMDEFDALTNRQLTSYYRKVI